MTICLHTACGCVQWLQWPDPPHLIRIPLAPGIRAAMDCFGPQGAEIAARGDSFKIRSFERKTVHRLPDTRSEYVLYEEVPE